MTSPSYASPTMLRVTAFFALLSLVGIILQFSLAPSPVIAGPDRLYELYASPEFRLQGWIVLAQVFFMFLALLGVSAARFRAAPGPILVALALLLLWQVLELVPRSVDVIAAAGSWGPAWAAETDAARRSELAAMLLMWDGVWNALGVVRRLVWGAAHLALGVAFVRGDRLERVLAALFLFNALRLLPRTLAWVIGWQAGAGFLSGALWFVLGMSALFGGLILWLLRSPGHAGRPAPLDSASSPAPASG